MQERLHKVLANMGIGSRRQCEELVAQGRVSIDGKTVTELGTKVDPRRQRLKVDGVPVKLPPLSYYLLNKPRGVVCTAADDERAPRAIDFAPKGAGRLHTIGRLDKESEGLIILTSDGALTERLTHPRHDIPKTYVVVVKGKVSPEAVAKIKKGVWLSEGKTAVSGIRILEASAAATRLEIELREGKNREIRRILARVGHPVRELRRIAIGPIGAQGLGRGKVRPLTKEEVEVLREAVGLGEGAPRKAERPEKKKPEPPSKPRAKPVAKPLPPPPRQGPVTELEIPPPAPRPRYEPDEDGVIVVRRPPVRFEEEE
jgi:23S rRNA pseudouridine2605 synthase